MLLVQLGFAVTRTLFFQINAAANSRSRRNQNVKLPVRVRIINWLQPQLHYVVVLILYNFIMFKSRPSKCRRWRFLLMHLEPPGPLTDFAAAGK